MRNGLRLRSWAVPMERRTTAPAPSAWAMALTDLRTDREVILMLVEEVAGVGDGLVWR